MNRPAAAPSQPPTSSRTRRWRGVAAALLGVVLLGIVAIWAYLTLRILPRIDAWRGPIERHATQTLGIRVDIAALRSVGPAWLPEIEMQDLRLIDAKGQVVLHLPRVDAQISWRTLWPGAWAAERVRLSRLRIESPELSVRVDPQGHWWVAGMELSPKPSGGTGALDWLLTQPEIRIEHGRLHWLNQSVAGAAAQEVLLQDVDLRLRNAGGLLHRRHALDLSATPPPDWGQPIALTASFYQPRLDWRSLSVPPLSKWSTWQGRVQVRLPRVDLLRLSTQVELPWAVASGHGGLTAEMRWQRGHWRSAEAQVSLQDVQMRLAPELEPLGLAVVQGRFTAQHGVRADEESYSLRAQDMSFRTAQGMTWPASDLAVAWQQKPVRASAPLFRPLRLAAAQDVLGGEASFSQVDLDVLTDLSARLPLAGALRDWLTSLKVRGQAHKVRVAWTGSPQAPRTYSASGQIDGLSLAAAPATAASAASLAPGASSPAPSPADATAVASAARPVEAAASASTQGAPPTGRPGLDHAQIRFEATQDGGTAQLQILHGNLVLPGVFEDPTVPMDRLAAQVTWTVHASAHNAPPGVQVEVQNAQFANADAQGHFDASWHTGAGHGTGRGGYLPGVLRLDGELTRADATRVARYLPLSIPEHTRHFVAQATRSGHASKVSFRVEGDLWDVPFGKPDRSPGVFNITADIEDADFCYAPPVVTQAGDAPQAPAADPPSRAASEAAAPAGTQDCRLWPMFKSLSGELVFDQQSMYIRHAQARLGTVGSGQFQVRNVDGRIARLDQDPVLDISGDLQGALNDLLQYVQATPIDRWTRHVLSHAKAEGTARAHLALHLTLDHMDDSQVDGHLLLARNALRLSAHMPWLQRLKGQIDFTQAQLQIKTTGTFLGSDVSVSGGTQPDGSVQVSAVGTLSAESLRTALDGPLAPGAQRDPTAPLSPDAWDAARRLASHLSGQAAASFTVHAIHDQTSWVFSSDTVGLALDLPSPLDKPAAQAWPLRIENVPLATAGGAQAGGEGRASAPSAAPRWDALRLSWGDVVQAQVVRDVSGPEARVLRGAVGVNTPARLAANGFNAQLTLPVLDVDAWQQAWRASSLAARTASAPSGRISGGAWPASGALGLDAVSLRGKTVLVSGRSFSNVHAEARQVAPGRWRVDLQGDQMRGQLEWLAGQDHRVRDRVVARFARLAVPKSLPSLTGLPSTPQPAAQASHWPDLDLAVDDFSLDSLKLGRLELQAQNSANTPTAASTAQDTPPGTWLISRLSLTLPEARLNATGQASPATLTQPPRTLLDFSLDLTNSGALLTRLGEPQTIRGGKGRLEGRVQWLASPLAFDAPSLSGHLHLAIESGQFLKVDPGAAKLLGVLSLQSLPRRLTLDFRDIFMQGFAFDHIDGDVDIAEGVASTRNLRMSGVQAVVFMEGQADVKQETQDLHVWVLPEINAGAASLAYAAINPAVGLGTFLAQMFLRKPFIEASTREFRITGPWKDPQIQRIPHRAGSTPAGALHPAASAPEASASAAPPTTLPTSP